MFQLDAARAYALRRLICATGPFAGQSPRSGWGQRPLYPARPRLRRRGKSTSARTGAHWKTQKAPPTLRTADPEPSSLTQRTDARFGRDGACAEARRQTTITAIGTGSEEKKQNKKRETCLGDGLYCRHEGDKTGLRTSRGNGDDYAFLQQQLLASVLWSRNAHRFGALDANSPSPDSAGHPFER